MRRISLTLSLALLLSLFCATAAFAGPVKDLAVVILRVEGQKPARLKLTAGTEKGVSVGTTGYLIDTSGKHVPNGEFKVVEVESKFCFAEVPSLAASDIDGSYGAVLRVP